MSEETPSTPLDPTPRLPVEATPSTPLDPTPHLPLPAPPSVSPSYMAPPPAPLPRPSRSRNRLFAGVVSAVSLLVIAAIAVGVILVGVNAVRRTVHTAGPVVASTDLTWTRGKAVFSDDFHDPGSGWTTNSLPSGTTFGYAPQGYVVVARGELDHFADSPYSTPVAQIAISVTATQSTDAPVGAGYGVSCWRGQDTAELRYDFAMTTAGAWTIDRRDGGLLAKPLILKRGTSAARLGSTPLAVEGMCATLGDQHTVRLAMFAGRDQIADITDSSNAMPDAGWQAGLMLTSSSIHDSTVTVTPFEERDLER